jgi:ABC-type dipeptide/oligopeptide/nickel transport system permease subunit
MKTLAAVLLIFIALMSLAAPIIAPHDPLTTSLENQLLEPSAEHFFGTDFLGRDVFSRAVYGGRQTLAMAAAATLIAASVGLLLGLIAAYGNRWLDLLASSLIDALLAAPGLLVALVILSILGSGQRSVTLAVAIAGIAPYARTTRDAIQAIQQENFVESAVSVGATRMRILLMHILPNARGILLAFLSVTFSWSLLNGAALTFLGFIGDPNTPDWGIMLAAGRQTFAVAPYEAMSAGVLLAITVGAVNQLTR